MIFCFCARLAACKSLFPQDAAYQKPRWNNTQKKGKTPNKKNTQAPKSMHDWIKEISGWHSKHKYTNLDLISAVFIQHDYQCSQLLSAFPHKISSFSANWAETSTVHVFFSVVTNNILIRTSSMSSHCTNCKLKGKCWLIQKGFPSGVLFFFLKEIPTAWVQPKGKP